MTLSNELVQQIAHHYLNQDAAHQAVELVESFYPAITLAEGYHIQQAIIATWEQAGHRVIGKKNGFTSEASQQAFGLTEPVFGHLLDKHLLPNGAEIAANTLINPRLECELAFRIGQTLTGPNITAAAILEAVEWVVPAFELVDFRVPGKLPTKYEASSYNVFLKYFILGDAPQPLNGLDLASLSMGLYRDEVQIATGQGTAVLGNPINSLIWLVNKLAETGRSLHAGETVMTGSFSPLQPITAGESYEARFEQFEPIKVVFR